MIDLGLARVGRLVQHTPQTWKAIHVAGTNGKGSICAYLSAMLSASGLSHAQFTSPHLVDRWDCIAVDGQPVSEAVFRDAEDTVKQRDRDGRVGATEFELLTATAFEIFHRQKVEYGVVEVGLGGKLDATNVLQQKAVTVIAKIGLDHQAFLGNTIQEIALQKAGIVRPGVPCVVDSSNEPSVLKVIEEHAREVGSKVQFPDTAAVEDAVAGEKLQFEPHQIQNLACAYTAFGLACPEQQRPLASFLSAIQQKPRPGRLQKLNIEKVTGQPREVLLDGAHNPQSAEVLAQYVDKHLRSDANKPVTWVLAATQGKDMDGIFSLLLRPGDQVAAVRFEPVDGMPWVKPTDPAELLQLAARHGAEAKTLYDAGHDVKGALAWASQAAADGPGGPTAGKDVDEWLIEDYKKDETGTFMQHIAAGVDLLLEDEQAVLVFSGGPTRRELNLSEARSYYNLALANHPAVSRFPPPPLTHTNPSDNNTTTTNRILLEERALDSYHNILFSLLLFWHHHSHWPRHLTLVSHAFKRDRLVEGHCAAIGFPLDRVRFVGINPPVKEVKKQAVLGAQLALGQWEADPHGVGLELSGKRKGRNVWGVDQRLFGGRSEEERERSGVVVRVLGEGEDGLEPGGVRPWV
ncbi:Mur ligase [Dichotomopilus funicola]|uniref:Mur ligase n=1 Tax=Dichotomopilus funicola TaxID=1934379 RepID=A0AAN6ZLZ8_9PEZI|nr:Mur ligase [Dichotomopilus funicola]